MLCKCFILRVTTVLATERGRYIYTKTIFTIASAVCSCFFNVDNEQRITNVRDRMFLFLALVQN